MGTLDLSIKHKRIDKLTPPTIHYWEAIIRKSITARHKPWAPFAAGHFWLEFLLALQRLAALSTGRGKRKKKTSNGRCKGISKSCLLCSLISFCLLEEINWCSKNIITGPPIWLAAPELCPAIVCSIYSLSEIEDDCWNKKKTHTNSIPLVNWKRFTCKVMPNWGRNN